MTFQAVATLSNQTALCIGEITSKEAAQASEGNPEFDGYGLYLVAVDARNPSACGQVLAKFASQEAAEKLAQFFRYHGQLVAA